MQSKKSLERRKVSVCVVMRLRMLKSLLSISMLTFRNSDVSAKVAIAEEPPESHFLEARSLQLREALQRDGLHVDATS